jgi:hypothetical protein
MIRAFLLGLLLAVSYLGYEFGGDLARYRAMQAALVELESCETDGDCERAWAAVKAAKR